MDMVVWNFRAPLGHCVQVSSDASLGGSFPPQTAADWITGKECRCFFFLLLENTPQCLSLALSLSVSSLTDGDVFWLFFSPPVSSYFIKVVLSVSPVCTQTACGGKFRK